MLPNNDLVNSITATVDAVEKNLHRALREALDKRHPIAENEIKVDETVFDIKNHGANIIIKEIDPINN